MGTPYDESFTASHTVPGRSSDAMDEADVRDYFSIDPDNRFLRKTHLHAFRTYFEKAPSTHSLEVRGANGTHGISIDTMRSWIATCDAFHDSHCFGSASQQAMRGRPMWLIDTLFLCLTRAERKPYLALSYVWGQVESASASRDSIGLLQTPYSLRKLRIPRTIHDAIRLTSLLGFRYLWVDRLCIIQDDPIDKQSQIRDMGGIFAKSILTIIAARGASAEKPLFGGWLTSHWLDPLPGYKRICVESPNHYNPGPPCPANMDGRSPLDQEFLVREHDIIMHQQMQNLNRATWSRRGWTFQEYLFSPRRLVFVGNTVNWDCHCASWHENQQHITARPCALPPSRWMINRMKRPDFERYTRLVALFAARDLTYPQDALDACESVLLNLSLVFPGGFISGLPELYFHEGLLWRPWRWSRKRVPKDPTENGQPAVLPSWSWVGWEGDVHSEVWSLFVESGLSKNSTTIDRRLTQVSPVWHSFNSTGPWVEISNSVASRSNEADVIESHQNTEERDEASLTRSRYLRIKTSSTSLYLGEPFPEDGHWSFEDSKSGLPKTMVLSLYRRKPPDHGPRVGYLAMNERGTWRGESPPEVVVFNRPGRRGKKDEVSFSSMDEVRLIELSRCERREEENSVTHVNVLCVEEGSEPGVLNRAAIGIVFDNAWDSLVRTEEIVILG